MRRLLRALGLALLIFVIVAIVAAAQGGFWASGLQIVNQSAAEIAYVTVTFYWAEGTPNAGQEAYRFSDQIPAGQAKSYYLPTAPEMAGLPEGFIGSAVVTSFQRVAVNLNTQVPTGSGAIPDNPNRVGTVSGILSPSPTLYLTQLMKDYFGWNSYVAVQNAGAKPTTITLTIYDLDGNEVDRETQQVGPFSVYVFPQSVRAQLPDEFIGSAVVDGGGANLAGMCNFYNAATSASTAQFHSYRGFSSGAQELYAPRIVKDFYGYQGGLRVQNVGTIATTVRARYYFGGEEYIQLSPLLAPGQAWTVYMGDGGPAVLAGIFGTGSARIESLTPGVPIVATVNGDNRTTGLGATYDAFPEIQATTTCLCPQIVAQYYGYSGGFQVMNTGTAEANLTVTLSMPGRLDTNIMERLDPNQSWSVFAPNHVGQDFNGSVVITSDQPIVAIGNMAFRSDVDPRYGENYGDSYILHTCVNR